MAEPRTDAPSPAGSGLTAPQRGSILMSVPWRWPLSLLLGAATVALSAQAAVPLPFTPVPMTLQGLAVILVGGVLGSAAGAGALGLYLVAGAFGAPVFALGMGGVAKLLGPTGGYLLAFPLAAALVGRVAQRGNLLRCAGAALLGMVTIHVGGLAQLAILGLPLKRAVALGTAPFVVVDLLKVVLAAGILRWSN
ncbi:MAG: biotin transporter BioY, partial [Gemmatimonadales bacterium]